MQQVDLVVVGAGFAGLNCAKAAAARGVRTVVLEKKTAAGDHPRTTGLLVKELADQYSFPQRLVKKIETIRLYNQNLDYIDLHSPGYYFLATDTSGVLQWLADQTLAAGAAIKYNQAFGHARDQGAVLQLTEQGISTRFLVGCDGARSRVAKNFNLGQNKHFLFGCETEYLRARFISERDEQCLHVFFDQELAPGYVAWVIPGLGMTQIGLAGRYPFRPRLDLFEKKITSIVDLKSAVADSCRAGLIPCGGTVTPVSRNRVMLLGDAAGMVSPLTAGGIHMALQLGHLAGLAIDDYLNNSTIHPAQAIKRHIPSYTYKIWMRRFFEMLSAHPSLLSSTFNSTLFKQLAQTVFFHHRGLLSFPAWRDLYRVASGKV